MRNYTNLLMAVMMLMAAGCATVYELASDELADRLDPPEKPVPAPDPVPEPDPDPKPEPAAPEPEKPAEPTDADCGEHGPLTERDILGLGWVWKPISDSDGRAAAWNERMARKKIVKMTLQQGATVIETGRFSGDIKNGCIPTYRFSRAGGRYDQWTQGVTYINGPGGVWVVSYNVGNPALRHEFAGPTGVIAPDGRVWNLTPRVSVRQ